MHKRSYWNVYFTLLCNQFFKFQTGREKATYRRKKAARTVQHADEVHRQIQAPSLTNSPQKLLPSSANEIHSSFQPRELYEDLDSVISEFLDELYVDL